MELISRLVVIVQSAVLDPSVGSALAVFVFSLLAEILAVFPSAIILSSPLLFFSGNLSIVLIAKYFFFVAVPFGLGNVVGSLPVYGLSYFGGKPAINRFQKYLHFSWKDVEKLEARFKGLWYDELIFLFLRTIPFMFTLPVNIVAGVLRMRIAPYLVLTLVGMTLKLMVMFFLAGLGIINL